MFQDVFYRVLINFKMKLMRRLFFKDFGFILLHPVDPV